MERADSGTQFTRRHFLAGLAGLALAPLSSACERAEKPLVVASHVWPGYELMFLAQREGWLPQGISLMETNSATVSRSVLAAGKADAAALTLDEVLRARAAGEPLTDDRQHGHGTGGPGRGQSRPAPARSRATRQS